MTDKTKMTLGRRGALALAGAAVGSGTITGFPTIWAQNIRDITLRQVGTGVSGLNAIAEQCKRDTGITLQLTVMDTDALAQRIATQSRTFDIADVEYMTTKKTYPVGTMQAIEKRRITNADKIVPIFTSGRLTPTSQVAQGTAPHTVGFVANRLATAFEPTQTEWMTLIPTIYNADTLGIRPDLISRPIRNWKDLVDPAFRGKASIVNVPNIGIMDAAMVMESAGQLRYIDKGNMTRAEIDRTTAFLIDLKRQGHFRAFWKTFDESVNLMASGEVIIQSMWSPAVAAVRSRGIACVYQPLEEGYRAWGGGLGIARHVSGLQLDAAYEYLNWYLSGWVGAYLNRQGYYSAVLETARTQMSAPEWDFWMEGKPAAADILAPDGRVMERAGTVRDGGSFTERMGRVSCWNSVMNEERYMVQKWNEFIAA
ncbi:ABC transporter substrate-binding protein [Plastoroseomonas arctica]|uniref:Extracellular solute-binding protein n=1 Tax=Plastoroseomonas arctica TaxID=1509237 RepID=A0AAF1KU28_9PROT|nr:extracellular solute-binding protein [Plastoroseomonas arctica]MBR0655362.1 extracellular solute-binding protein [Plastoroseomonas arctica]